MRAATLALAALTVLLSLPASGRAEAPAEAAPPPAAITTGAPLPLPSLDGKPMAIPASASRFQLPMQYARVVAYYQKLYAGAADVTVTPGRNETGRTLTLVSRRLGDAWSRAVLRESAVGTRVELVRVTRFAEERIGGSGVPQVRFVLPRSQEARRTLDEIQRDHLEKRER